MNRNQNGSVLIIMVIVLAVVASIGAVAIRNSVVSTNLLTAGVADRIMLQEANSAMFQLKDRGTLAEKELPEGIFGFAKQHQNKEVVFCYKGENTNTFFSTTKASLMYVAPLVSTPNSSSIGDNGYCNANSDYSNSRNIVLTQVSLRYTSDSISTFTGDAAAVGDVYVAYITTVMPNMNPQNTNQDNINTCLSKRLNQPRTTTNAYTGSATSESVSACLTRLYIPHKTIMSKFSPQYGFA